MKIVSAIRICFRDTFEMWLVGGWMDWTDICVYTCVNGFKLVLNLKTRQCDIKFIVLFLPEIHSYATNPMLQGFP